MRNCQHAQKWSTPPDLSEDLSGPEGENVGRQRDWHEGDLNPSLKKQNLTKKKFNFAK